MVLKTIKYICEDIDEASIANNIAVIYSTVITYMGGDVKSIAVRRTDLEALQAIIKFLETVFKNKPERDRLMGLLLQNCTFPDDETKINALCVLTDIFAYYYPYTADYMQVIFNLTVPRIEQCKEEDEVLMQAIELWIEIADVEMEKAYNEEEAKKDGTVVEEIDKSRHYCEGALVPLLKALFSPLSKQDEDSDDDEDEWNLPHAAATCISELADCVGDKIIAPIIQFFEGSCMNPDWHIRDAATIAFGSILGGPSTETLKPFLSNPKLLSLFIQHMKDPHPVVRASTAWTLSRMCELHVGVVVTDKERFEAICQAFKLGLADETRVAMMCMWGFKMLAEALDEFIEGTTETNPLSQHFSELITLLFQCGEKSGCSTKQRKAAYMAMGALVHCSSPENLCVPPGSPAQTIAVDRVLVMCLDRIEAMTSATSIPDKKNADELEALVSGLMTECVAKLENKVAAIADRVCIAYLTLYSKKAGAAAQEEAVLGLGTFAMAMGQGVERYAEHIGRVLLECISKPNEVDVCKCAIGSLGDLARSMEDKFGKFVAGIVPALFKLLTTQDVDRSIFSPVMSTLGDMAQCSMNEFKQFIPQVIGVVQQAMACKVDMSDDDDRDFLFELQENCFACIAGIQTGLSTINQNPVILSYSGGITQCINLAYQNMDRPESLSNAIVGAICDLVIAAGPKVKEVIRQGGPWEQFPMMITTILKNAEKPMTQDNCKLAIERIQQNMQN